jgi:uncharacterized membrane protein
MDAHVNEVDPAFESPHDERVRRVEILISNLLRIGVTASLTIIVIGTVVTFMHHHEYLHSREQFRIVTRAGTHYPHTLWEVAQGVRKLEGQAIVTAGLLLLITTPVVRVGVSIFAFVYQHDRKFVVITTIVFLLLLLSFVLGKAEG